MANSFGKHGLRAWDLLGAAQMPPCLPPPSPTRPTTPSQAADSVACWCHNIPSHRPEPILHFYKNLYFSPLPTLPKSFITVSVKFVFTQIPLSIKTDNRPIMLGPVPTLVFEIPLSTPRNMVFSSVSLSAWPWADLPRARRRHWDINLLGDLEQAVYCSVPQLPLLLTMLIIPPSWNRVALGQFGARRRLRIHSLWISWSVQDSFGR